MKDGYELIRKVSLTKHRRFDIAQVLIRCIPAIFAVVALAVVVCSGNVDFARKHDYISRYQWVFCLAGIAFAAVLVLLTKAIGSNIKICSRFKTPLAFNVVLVALCILVFVYQLLAIHESWFRTDWDVATLVIPYEQQAEDWSDWYFSAYPNQRFLYCMFEVISNIGLHFGVEDRYLALVIGGSVNIVIALFCMGVSAKWAFGYRVGYLAIVFGAFFIGSSPWFYVPYSDSYGILWPILLVFLYQLFEKYRIHYFIKWFCLTFVTCIGYSIKPTVLFAFAAIVLVELAAVVRVRRGKQCYRDRKGAIKRTCLHSLKLCMAVVLSVVVSSSAVSFSEKGLRPVDNSCSFSMTHFLMMGANYDAGGVWNEGDVEFSKSFDNSRDRNSENISEWTSRIEQMGICGLSNLALCKTLTNFSDGTFTWAGEGKFWEEIPDKQSFFKKYYGIGSFDSEKPSSDSGLLFQLLSQISWFSILSGVSLLIFKKKYGKIETIMLVSLLALVLFLTIFECRARYLYLYLPFFVTLGVVGWDNITYLLSDGRFRKHVIVAK